MVAKLKSLLRREGGGPTTVCFVRDSLIHLERALEPGRLRSALVARPYLQPFLDVNKRTGRISANLPLFKAVTAMAMGMVTTATTTATGVTNTVMTATSRAGIVTGIDPAGPIGLEQAGRRAGVEGAESAIYQRGCRRLPLLRSRPRPRGQAVWSSSSSSTIRRNVKSASACARAVAAALSAGSATPLSPG